MNYKGNFGQDPGQATIVIQSKHDKQEVKNRCVKKSDDKNYWFYHVGLDSINDESKVRIDRGDLVFSIGTSAAPRASSIMKAAVPVVSCLNGLYVRKERGEENLQFKDSDDDRINERLSKSMRFIGIALGWSNVTPDVASHEKTQITTRVRGTGKAFNNGYKPIVPGDTVVWKLPNKKDVEYMRREFPRYGRSNEKVVPMLMPLREYLKMTFDDNLVSVIVAGNGRQVSETVQDVSSTPFSLAFKKFLLDVYLKGVENKYNLNPPNFVDTLKDLKDEQDEYFRERNPMDNGGKDSQTIVDDIFDIDRAQPELDLNQLRNKIGSILTPFLSIQDDIKRRIVGTAVSYAEPGQDVTIIINN